MCQDPGQAPNSHKRYPIKSLLCLGHPGYGLVCIIDATARDGDNVKNRTKRHVDGHISKYSDSSRLNKGEEVRKRYGLTWLSRKHTIEPPRWMRFSCRE